MNASGEEQAILIQQRNPKKAPQSNKTENA